MILSVTLNPSLDRTVFVDGLALHDTNRILRAETDAGGKGINLSRIVAELGGETFCTGFLAGGPGAFVERVLDTDGIGRNFVQVEGSTRVNTSIEDGSGRPPTTLNERGPEVDPRDWERFLALFESLAQAARWAAIGGSLPPGVPTDAYRRLVEIAQANDCRVCVDADGPPMAEALRARPDLIKPNGAEAGRLLGHMIDSPETALEAARGWRRGGVEFAMVSLGADGAVLSCETGDWIGESPRVEARSTIGSGDSLLGGFLARLQEGNRPEEAFRWGLAAGAATAMTDGSTIGSRSDIESLYERARVRPAEAGDAA